MDYGLWTIDYKLGTRYHGLWTMKALGRGLGGGESTRQSTEKLSWEKFPAAFSPSRKRAALCGASQEKYVVTPGGDVRNISGSVFLDGWHHGELSQNDPKPLEKTTKN